MISVSESLAGEVDVEWTAIHMSLSDLSLSRSALVLVMFFASLSP